MIDYLLYFLVGNEKVKTKEINFFHLLIYCSSCIYLVLERFSVKHLADLGIILKERQARNTVQGKNLEKKQVNVMINKSPTAHKNRSKEIFRISLSSQEL